MLITKNKDKNTGKEYVNIILSERYLKKTKNGEYVVVSFSDTFNFDQVDKTKIKAFDIIDVSKIKSGNQ